MNSLSKEKRILSAQKRSNNLAASYRKKNSEHKSQKTHRSSENLYAVTYLNFNKDSLAKTNKFNPFLHKINIKTNDDVLFSSVDNCTAKNLSNKKSNNSEIKSFNYYNSTTNSITNTTNQAIHHNNNHFTKKLSDHMTMENVPTVYYSQKTKNNSGNMKYFDLNNLSINNVNLKLLKTSSTFKNNKNLSIEKMNIADKNLLKINMLNNSIYKKEGNNFRDVERINNNKSRSRSVSNEKEKDNFGKFSNSNYHNGFFKFSKPYKTYSDNFIKVNHCMNGYKYITSSIRHF